MHEGAQSSNRPQSYFVTELNVYRNSSQHAKEYNTLKPECQETNHIIMVQINVFIRLYSGF